MFLTFLYRGSNVSEGGFVTLWLCRFLAQQISPGIVNTEIEAHAYNNPGRLMEHGADAKNIAEAVVYILSTPRGLQVTYCALCRSRPAVFVYHFTFDRYLSRFLEIFSSVESNSSGARKVNFNPKLPPPKAKYLMGKTLSSSRKIGKEVHFLRNWRFTDVICVFSNKKRL